MSDEYNVNDIIYLSLKGGRSNIPSQVVEKIIKQKADSREVEYSVKLPGADQTIVSLSSLDAAIFSSLSNLRHDFISSMEKLIDKNIGRCKELEAEYFITQENLKLIEPEDVDSVSTEKNLIKTETNVSNPDDSMSLPNKVILPDGTVATLKGI